ncbi:hypothetical protein BABINDRAFT_159573 [Babjeviella inositovora NRRL Y-12698]|uniref:Uncharacterized protein n=1 Tax=Babjeviella inositovora NRRL Y-12698 TaxID=984486 RepID=A0A1E3QZK7_9ASCO|nr:uncharacterized protein BABINDRAFT_159573 [Babjeviella inositovora NRRL Y-12698]ODQ83119.1 hypothetical protein BABINDRAFT_159573 [Babjeviella inositovora NRRL Y-12698]
MNNYYSTPYHPSPPQQYQNLYTNATQGGSDFVYTQNFSGNANAGGYTYGSASARFTSNGTANGTFARANGAVSGGSNEYTDSPTFSTLNPSSSSSSQANGNTSNVSLYQLPSRARYLVSKSFEDDYEFMPEISSKYAAPLSPNSKFNPYTSSVFSPNSLPSNVHSPISTPTQTRATAVDESPRVHTPRIKRPLEIKNPLTGMKVASPVAAAK